MSHETLNPELNKEEVGIQLEDARKFVKSKLTAREEPYDPNIADSDGLVTYINATTNPPPEELVKERQEISAVLEGLMGIVTAVLLETAGDDEAARHKPELWTDPIRFALSPFIAGMAAEEVTYRRQVRGVEVATQFLNILIDAVTEEGGALNAFRKFLSDQGETIRIQGENTQEGYKYACIGMVHEIFQVENGEWIYVPKIRAYFTSFTRETFRISSSCVSYEQFKFDFRVSKFVAAFKIETWRKEQWFRDEVRDFIKTYTGADIAKSRNYLDAILKSKKPSGALALAGV